MVDEQSNVSLSASDKGKKIKLWEQIAGVIAVLRDRACLPADGAARRAFPHRSRHEQRQSVLTHAQSAERPSHGPVGPAGPLPACPAARCRTPPYTCKPLPCPACPVPTLPALPLPLPCPACPYPACLCPAPALTVHCLPLPALPLPLPCLPLLCPCLPCLLPPYDMSICPCLPARTSLPHSHCQLCLRQA